MKADANTVENIVPSNKFYPPHIDKSQSLLRSALIEKKLPSQNHNKKAVIIEAQAGQGKTTLAVQFLEYYNCTYIWYQIGMEDSDPIQLLSSLLTNLSTNLQDFNSPKLKSILTKGTIGPLDLIPCANILLHDLDKYLTDDIYLVFDDLHLIAFDGLTNRLFEHIIDTSPPQVHFICLTRHPLEIKGKTIRNGSQITYLNTQDLALNNLEIEALFNGIFNKVISKQEAATIHRLTKGWIMGIILASHPISGRKDFWLNVPDTAVSSNPNTGHMLDYFEEEIFAQIPKDLHDSFLLLSFLQEIHSDLATEITSVDDFGTILSQMTEDNYFIYHLDDKHSTFRFHHFFQEFLQQRGRDRFSQQEVAKIHRQEADFYLRKEMIEKALTCYRNGEDYRIMEKVLKEHGMSLIAKNRTLTILTLLQTIPEQILFQHKWLTLYTGLLQVDFVPQKTLLFFDAVRDHFVKTGEETGELLAMAQTIYYHFVVSGEYNKGAELLSRTESLLRKNEATLPIAITIMAARNLASGYCFFTGEMKKASEFIDKACALAQQHDLHNFIASTRFIKGYINLLCGNRATFLREAEACFQLIHDPLVGESNKLTIRVMHLCYLSMAGNHNNFRAQQLALQQSIDNTVVNQTVAAPYLFVWGSSNLFSLGMPQQALELLDKGLSVTSTSMIDHMHSQLLQWKAFGLALTTPSEEAAELISEATKLRSKAGGLFYTAFHFIVAGAVHVRLKKYKKAQDFLEKALTISQSIPSTYLVVCALFNLSYLKYKTAGADAAFDDLKRGLSLMSINDYTHFWTWEPVMMTELLSLAVRNNIEESFCEKLARTHLDMTFSDRGNALLLLHFTLLDSFQITFRNKVIFTVKDLTPFQREMLGLIITAKKQKISKEKIELELWPDSSPENARKSMDSLLTRLRKLFAPHLPDDVSEYLSLQKGILCLTNNQIDAFGFLKAAQAGLSHSWNNEWWQAQNAFQTAFSLWKGALPEDIFRSEQVLSFNDMLLDQLVEMAIVWAKSRASAGKPEEAISIVEQVLQINYLEENLTILLYRFHIHNNNPLQANETLEQYRTALVKANYTEQEISSFIDEITRRDGLKTLSGSSIVTH